MIKIVVALIIVLRNSMILKAGTNQAIVDYLANYFKNIVENHASFAEEVGNAQFMVPVWRTDGEVQKILDDQYQLLVDIGFAEE